MTLPASGGITGAQIRTELGQSGGNLVFPDPTTRWLSEKDTGSIILPTDFYSKVSVKTITGQRQQALSGSSVSWNGMDFGIDYPGRVLVACLCLRGIGVLNISSVTIGGVAAVGQNIGWDPGGGGNAIGSGIYSASGVSGTIGNVVINLGPGTLNYGAIVMLSMSNAVFSGGSPTINGIGTGFSSSLSSPAAGINLMTVANTSGNTMSLSGISKRVEMLAGSFSFAVCWNNKVTGGTTPVAGAWSGSVPYGVVVRSYSQ